MCLFYLKLKFLFAGRHPGGLVDLNLYNGHLKMDKSAPVRTETADWDDYYYTLKMNKVCADV